MRIFSRETSTVSPSIWRLAPPGPRRFRPGSGPGPLYKARDTRYASGDPTPPGTDPMTMRLPFPGMIPLAMAGFLAAALAGPARCAAAEGDAQAGTAAASHIDRPPRKVLLGTAICGEELFE